MIKHEIIHYKICLKFIGDIKSTIKINFFVANPGFGYSAKCLIHYPLIYNLPQYYPKHIFVEFVHYLYDMIYNIFSLRGLKYLIPYTMYFIKNMFKNLKFKRKK